ncbi:hypothetical protein ABZ128_03910 [Streptomyces sp. NPDC006326]|uniref:hypothetical protein n=1 Tax=Streptomyces sp. NPDC006326 TaxID=3156752 RepID=UPI0033B1C0BB
MTWRLLRALALSRHEDVTSEDSSLWADLNRVVDDAVDAPDVRPLTARLASYLTSLTDHTSRHVQTGLTEKTRSQADGLLHEVRDRLRRDSQDIGLLRRLASMTEAVADEVLDQASTGAPSLLDAATGPVHSSAGTAWSGHCFPASAAMYPAASA